MGDQGVLGVSMSIADEGCLPFEVENLVTVSPGLLAVCSFNETDIVVAH